MQHSNKMFNNAAVGKDQPRVIRGKPLDKIIHPKGLGWALFDAMKKFTGEIAQICQATGRRETFNELLKRCIRTALHMKKRNLHEGKVVALCTHNQMDSCVPFIAATFLGCLPVSYDPTQSFDDNKHLLSEVQPKIMFVSEDSVDMMRTAAKELDHEMKFVVFSERANEISFSEFLVELPEEDEINFEPVACKSLNDTCLIAFSSGSTGCPKGICVSHLAILANIYRKVDSCKVGLTISTLYWISGISNLISCTVNCCTRLICEKFDAVKLWDWIGEFKVNFIFFSPHLVLECLNRKPRDVDVREMKMIAVGGSSLTREQIQEVQAAFPDSLVFYGYGQTEIGGGICGLLTTRMPEIISGNGMPVGYLGQGMDVKVVDPDTEEMLGPNEEGELRIKSDHLFKDYYNRDSSSCFDKDGWYKTCDLFYYDENDCLYFVERKRDVLKYRQHHVITSILEAKIKTHPAVLNAVVIGRPHEIDGEHPMACVMLKSGYEHVTEEEIEDYANNLLDDNKKLRGGVKILKEFPLTPSTKINKKVLREWIKEGLI